MDHPVFTYGTLQIPAVMEAVTGKKFVSEPAVLKNYARFFIKKQVYPGIIAATGGSVDGRIYFAVDESTLHCLDIFEDVLYERKLIETYCNNRKIPAHVYIVGPEHRHMLGTEHWDINVFQRKYLAAYIKSCSKFQREYKRLLKA